MAYEGPSYSREGPKNFDPEDPKKDPVAFFEQREHRVREKYVKMGEAKLLREQLKQCYYREGVNHLQNCKEIAKAYMESIKNVGVHAANSGEFDRPVA